MDVGATPPPRAIGEETYSDLIKFMNGRIGIYEYQAPAVLNQAAPTQNTYYTLLEETNCLIYAATFNIEDTNETLGLRITRDGVVSTVFPKAATHSTRYEAFPFLDPITRTEGYGLDNTKNIAEYKAFMVMGRSIKIEINKTTAAGTGNLTGIAAWGKLKDAA